MKQFVVIGCGRFGTSIAKTLNNLGHEVLAIDYEEDLVQEISSYVTHAVQADATDEKAIEALGIKNFDTVIITIGTDIQSSVLATILVKELGVERVVVKAHDELHAKVLYKIGADKVVFPERDMGIRLAHNLVSTNILDYIDLSPTHNIVEITPPKEWHDKTLKELNTREKHGINIIAIKRNNSLNMTPNADTIITEDDIILVSGDKKEIEKL